MELPVSSVSHAHVSASVWNLMELPVSSGPSNGEKAKETKT